MNRSLSRWKVPLGLMAGGAAAYLLYKLATRNAAAAAPASVGGPLNMWLFDENAVEKAKAEGTVAKEDVNQYLNYFDQAGRKLLVLYGTEYGTSKRVADKLAETLFQTYKMQPRVVNMSDFKHIDFSRETLMLVIVSTYGDGVPPTEARDFYEFLHTKDAPSMAHMRYSLMALGDSNYPAYCKAGRDFDKRFGELGAKSVLPRSESDQENWDVINRWMTAASTAANAMTDIPDTEEDYLADRITASAPAAGFGRLRPFLSSLAVSRPLTTMTQAEDKETIHFELDLTDSGLTYVPGDALGIYPVNAPADVAAVLAALKLPGSTAAQYPTWHYKTDQQKAVGSVTLADVLAECYDLKAIKPELLKLIAEHATNPTEKATVADLLASGSSASLNKALATYVAPREIIDVLEEFSSRPPLDLFLSHLGRLLPRYYSISSSQRTDANRVCVTAAIVRYETLGRKRTGVCTTYLADRVAAGGKVAVFVNRNPDFRLPQNVETPIIMVGPGTGLAPFRSFLQERKFHGDKSPAVLFFGCRSAKQDFLYADELNEYVSAHKLQLHTAFSRDQSQKVYVQQRLWEQGAAVWKLLQSGAHFYVCGDAAHMAGDVHETLLRIAGEIGGLSVEAAATYVADLEATHRYQKDVWF